MVSPTVWERYEETVDSARRLKSEARMSFLACPGGGTHKWSYSRPMYRCEACGFETTKDRLKTITD